MINCDVELLELNGYVINRELTKTGIELFNLIKRG